MLHNTGMVKLLVIGIGGAFGSVCRYLLAGWVQQMSERVFPVGTLAVNVSGCLLIGILGALFAGQQVVREEYRVLLMVGVLGGFTTFSTFGYETLQLVNERQLALAGLNVLLSNGASLVAVWIGYRVTQKLVGV